MGCGAPDARDEVDTLPFRPCRLRFGVADARPVIPAVMVTRTVTGASPSFPQTPTPRHSRESGNPSSFIALVVKPLIQGAMKFAHKVWIPAFAGMTRRGFRGDDGMGSVATHTNS